MKPAPTHGILVLDGPQCGTIFPIDGRATLGRASDSSIHLPHDGVSRQHARIVSDSEGRHVLVDLDSTNGTLVDRFRVQRLELRAGTIFEIMGTRMVYISLSSENGHEDPKARVHQFSSLRPTNDYLDDYLEVFESGAADTESRIAPRAPGHEDITAVRRQVTLARLDLRTPGTPGIPRDTTESGTTYWYTRGAEGDPPSSS